MRYFDLHCDTLCAAYDKQTSLYGGGLHVDLSKTSALQTYLQCCAVWIPDTITKDSAYAYFQQRYALLEKLPQCKTGASLLQLHQGGGVGLIPTVEGGTVLGGSLLRIADLRTYGVKMLTLTWNADNEIGGGIGGAGVGLTSFGKQAIAALERAEILVDISHASVSLFEDVCTYSTKPFVASHSNAKALCGHRRNLNNAQIKEIVKRKGLIGVNFFTEFLSDNPQAYSMDRIVEQIDYFLSLGAQDILAMGSDFDGADLPPDMVGLVSVPALYEKLAAKGYNQQLLDKIFYSNACNFFLKSYGIFVPIK